MNTAKSDFPTFFTSYLNTALWSSTIDEGEQNDARNGEAFGDHFNTYQINADALETLRAHAFSFWSRMWFYLDSEQSPTASIEQAGHDFWLTQNGHGAGFWDGDWPVYGDMLTKLSKRYPEINLCVLPGDEIGIA